MYQRCIDCPTPQILDQQYIVWNANTHVAGQPVYPFTEISRLSELLSLNYNPNGFMKSYMANVNCSKCKNKLTCMAFDTVKQEYSHRLRDIRLVSEDFGSCICLYLKNIGDGFQDSNEAHVSHRLALFIPISKYFQRRRFQTLQCLDRTMRYFPPMLFSPCQRVQLG